MCVKCTLHAGIIIALAVVLALAFIVTDIVRLALAFVLSLAFVATDIV